MSVASLRDDLRDNRTVDGRTLGELLAMLQEQFSGIDPAMDVREFLGRLAQKGLIRDAADA